MNYSLLKTSDLILKNKKLFVKFHREDPYINFLNIEKLKK